MDIEKKDSYLISAIVPFYNAERYIEKCVRSILNQEYEHFELLLVDNGSTDKSADIVRSISDSRVTIIHAPEKQGVSFARNKGIEHSSGDYIAFIDADDWVAPNYFREAISVATEHDLDWVMGGTCKVLPDRVIDPMSMNPSRYFEYEGEGIRKMIYKVIGYETEEAPELNPFHAAGPCCKLYRSSICKSVRFNEILTIGEDTVFNVDFLRRARKCGAVSSLWYCYRKNDGSATGGYSLETEPAIRRMLERLRLLEIDDDRGLYYVDLRAVRQLGGLLSRAKQYKQDDAAKKMVEIMEDPFWGAIAKRTPTSKLNVGCKTKLAIRAIKSNSIVLRWLTIKAFGV